MLSLDPLPQMSDRMEYLLASSQSSQVLDINSVLARREHSIVTHGRLGARTNTLQVLVRRHTLALGKVFQEDINVALEADDVLTVRRQEREDSHLAVRAFEQVPGYAGKLDTLCKRNGLAVGAPCAGRKNVSLSATDAK